MPARCPKNEEEEKEKKKDEKKKLEEEEEEDDSGDGGVKVKVFIMATLRTLRDMGRTH